MSGSHKKQPCSDCGAEKLSTNLRQGRCASCQNARIKANIEAIVQAVRANPAAQPGAPLPKLGTRPTVIHNPAPMTGAKL